MESPEPSITLGSLPIGGRLLVRSRKDWRTAVVCRMAEDHVTIAVSSPKGGCYRLKRPADAEVGLDGPIPYLQAEPDDPWRENFALYDTRW